MLLSEYSDSTPGSLRAAPLKLVGDPAGCKRHFESPRWRSAHSCWAAASDRIASQPLGGTPARMSLYEALRGARVELAGINSPAAKLHRLAGITQTFATEILQQLLVIPYAVRALSTYRGLPRLQLANARPSRTVSLVETVRYGDKRRNVMDVYLPPKQTLPNGETACAPVALFCHGGVWAAGDKWHYAPMATRLAGAGVLTLVMHYSLYPDALVPEMVSEVSEALSWTLDHVAAMGGDPSRVKPRVSLVGHSAGAQLAAMALLHRAKAATGQQNKPDLAKRDGRMPKRLVGMAGVYDLAKHFHYEAHRRVEELSTMKRAAGGAAKFPSVSPVVILAHTLRDAEAGNSGREQVSASDSRPAGPPLRGEALAHRIGFERQRTSMADRLATIVGPSAEAAPDLAVSLAEARQLPPVVLMSSCGDHIVPWYESAEMYWMLHDCGVRCRHLVYNWVQHADFVTGWRAKAAATSVADIDLPDQCRDMLAIVKDDGISL